MAAGKETIGATMSFPITTRRFIHRRSAWLRIALLACLCGIATCQIQCLFLPHDEDVIGYVPNKRPHVRITSGLLDVDSLQVDYRVDLRWHGWDEDGIVTAFEWALDDTTLEGSWHATKEFGGHFTFPAAPQNPDPRSPSWLGWHRFFIRSVDNESAASVPVTRFFNAKTIAPETRITSPRYQPPLVFLPRTFDVVWEGEDLDSSAQDQIPEFYEYKLVKFEFNADPLEALLESENFLLDTLQYGDRTGWIRVPSEITSVRIENLPASTIYAFSVRAIDEAGAVEPTLDPAENYILFEVTTSGCKPIVTMYEPRLGAFTFPRDGLTWTVTVPSGVPLRFTWIGDSPCGLRVGKVKYALDPIGDTHAPDGIGGWTDWLDDWSGLMTPFVFPVTDEGSVHHFFLKMRDGTHDPSSERFCWVQIEVLAFPFDRTVLIVDDATPPRPFAGTDAEHDALRDRILACAWDALEPGEQVDVFSIYHDNEGSVHPRSIPLSLVAQYKLIIWNSFFHARAQSGLAHNEVQRKVLSSYVGAGGRLYLFGSKPVSSLADDDYNDEIGTGICPDLPGEPDPVWDEESFIWKFLHIRSCVKGPRDNKMDGWVGARSVHPSYPDLRIDPEVWDPWRPDRDGNPTGGITAFQVYKAPEGGPPDPDSGLDTIYVAETFDYGGTSELGGEPCALRYAPPPDRPDLFQGRVFLQTFDMLFVDEESAREAACHVINWLMTGRDE